MTLELNDEETHLIREWFENTQDINSVYLERKDYELAKRMYEHLGWRVPHSILNNLGVKNEREQ